ncbi:MAG: hypothetical protein AAGG06_08520 [Pseudomonadota bacterium]
MTAGPELQSFDGNLGTLRGNVAGVRDGLQDTRDIIRDVELSLQTPAEIARCADQLESLVATQKIIFKIMSKAPGVVGRLGRVGEDIANDIQRAARDIERRANEVQDRINESPLANGLDEVDRAIERDQARLLEAEAKIAETEDAVENTIEAFEFADDPRNPLRPEVRALSRDLDRAVAPANDALAGPNGINALFGDVREAQDDLNGLVPQRPFDIILGAQRDLREFCEIVGRMDRVLGEVYKVLRPIEPVLDAAGFIFEITVQPVIDYILDTLGIDKIIDRVKDKITDLLPSPNIFDGVADDVEQALDKLGEYLDVDDLLNLDPFLQRVDLDFIGDLGDAAETPLGIAAATNDILTGSAEADVLDAGAGNDLIRGLAGDDLLTAGEGDDILQGGGGQDQAAFRGRFGEYEFYQDATASKAQALLAPIYFTHSAPRDRRIDDGTDQLASIETFVFADLTISKESLLNNVFVAPASPTTDRILRGNRNPDDDDDFLFARNYAIDIRGQSGDDRVVGSEQNDSLFGGSGNDVIESRGGDDTIDGGGGIDTWRFFDASGGGNDIEADLREEVLRNTGTSILRNIENVNAVGDNDALVIGDDGANWLSSGSGQDILDGQGGSDRLEGGEDRDILVGGDGVDSVFGEDGNDFLVAGASVVRGQGEFYDGGAGSSDTLSYAQAISYRDTRAGIERTYSSEFPNRDREMPGPVEILAASGRIIRYDDAGRRLATDLAVNVESYIGSEFADTLRGVDQEDLILDGGGGDDFIRAGKAGRGVRGGEGNDRVIAGTGGANYEGGGGFDILDLGAIADVRWLVRTQGAIGSTLRAFDAQDSEGIDLDNNSGPSVIASGNVEGFELFLGSAEDDRFSLFTGGGVTVEGRGGRDEISVENGDNNPFAVLDGGAGDDTLTVRSVDEATLIGGAGDDALVLSMPTGSTGAAFGDARNGSLTGEDAGDDRFTLSGGQWSIEGGDGTDSLGVRFSGMDADLALRSIVAIDRAGNGDPIYRATVTGVEELIGDENDRDLMRGADIGERFIGRGGSDLMEGRGGGDALYGGAGSDTAFGGAGDDLLHGGAGSDILDGGGDLDTVSYAYSAPNGQNGEIETTNFGGVTVDLAAGFDVSSGRTTQIAMQRVEVNGSVVRTEVDTLWEIENAIGGDGNDSFFGDDGDNGFSGGEGDDTFTGLGGADVLTLGTGNDTAFGGQGNDTIIVDLGDKSIDGGAGTDTLDFGNLAGTVTVDFEAGTYQAVFSVDRPVWEVGDMNGPMDARVTDQGVALTPQDVLEADPAFVNDEADEAREIPADERFTITLATMREQAIGRFTGIERFVGGTAASRIVLSDGVDRVFATASSADSLDFTRLEERVVYNLANGASNTDVTKGDTIRGIEGVLLTPFDDVLMLDDGDNRGLGGRGDDRMFGRAGDDRLFGGIGDDIANGEAGADRLIGGSGNDFLRGQADADTLNGGSGLDTLFGGSGGDVIGGGAGNDRMLGNGGNDVLRGGDGNDLVNGGPGNDLLFGGEGRDLILGGAGNDDLRGDAGADTLQGNSGNDRLRGGAGADTLNGGTGQDVLSGGGGLDRFAFDTNYGSARITDFAATAGELLDFSGHVRVNGLADLQIIDRRADTIVMAPGDGAIVLVGLDTDLLEDNNFVF